MSVDVTRRICNVIDQGQHAAGQSCYVLLGRHLAETEGLLKVIGSHVHRTCSNISETAQGSDVTKKVKASHTHY